MPASASLLASGASSTAATACTFTAQAAGTILLLGVSSDDYRLTTGSNRPESSGWTLVSTGQDFLGAYVWQKTATGAETSVSYAIGSAVSSAWVVITVTGVDAVLDNPSPTALHNHGGGAATTQTATTTAGSRFGVAFLHAMHSSTDLTAPTGWTNSFVALGGRSGPSAGSRERVDVGTRAFTGGSTLSASATPNTKLCSYGVLLVFKESSGGGGATLTATPADTVAASDVAAAARAASRGATDAVAATDAAASTSGRARDVADAVAVSDSLTVERATATAATVPDVVAATDAVSAAWSRNATVADGVAATDTGDRSTVRAGSLADAVGVGDDATGTRTGAATATTADPVSVGDTLTVAWSRAATLTDGAAIGEAVSGTFNRVTTVADFLAATDTPSADRSSDSGAGADDPVPVGDTLTGAATRSRAADDSVHASDALEVAWGRVAVLSDPLDLADAVAAQRVAQGDGRPVPDPGLVLDEVEAGLHINEPGQQVRLTRQIPGLDLTVPDARLELT